MSDITLYTMKQWNQANSWQQDFMLCECMHANLRVLAESGIQRQRHCWKSVGFAGFVKHRQDRGDFVFVVRLA